MCENLSARRKPGRRAEVHRLVAVLPSVTVRRRSYTTWEKHGAHRFTLPPMAGWPQRSHRALRGHVGAWLVRSSRPQKRQRFECAFVLRLRAVIVASLAVPIGSWSAVRRQAVSAAGCVRCTGIQGSGPATDSRPAIACSCIPSIRSGSWSRRSLFAAVTPKPISPVGWVVSAFFAKAFGSLRRANRKAPLLLPLKGGVLLALRDTGLQLG